MRAANLHQLLLAGAAFYAIVHGYFCVGIIDPSIL